MQDVRLVSWQLAKPPNEVLCSAQEKAPIKRLITQLTGPKNLEMHDQQSPSQMTDRDRMVQRTLNEAPTQKE